MRRIALPVVLVADALGVDPAVLAAAVARAPSRPAPPRRRAGLRRATSGATFGARDARILPAAPQGGEWRHSQDRGRLGAGVRLGSDHPSGRQRKR